MRVMGTAALALGGTLLADGDAVEGITFSYDSGGFLLSIEGAFTLSSPRAMP